jgi:hypothetical protein
VTRFQFVADHQARYGVKRLCRILRLARSSYVIGRAALSVGPHLMDRKVDVRPRRSVAFLCADE